MPAITGAVIAGLGIAAGAAGGIIGASGAKPSIKPPRQPIPREAASEAIASALAVLPEVRQLARATDRFSQEQITRMLESAAPGLSALLRRQVGTLGALSRGELPADVQAAVERSAAARALAGGFGGAPLAGGLTAQQLGLTSLQLLQAGLGSTQQLLAGVRQFATAQPFNITSMFFTPQQILESQLQFEALKQRSNTVRETLRLQLDPEKAALGESISSIGGLLTGIGTAGFDVGTGTEPAGISSGGSTPIFTGTSSLFQPTTGEVF